MPTNPRIAVAEKELTKSEAAWVEQLRAQDIDVLGWVRSPHQHGERC
jgi:hypothetical protein